MSIQPKAKKFDSSSDSQRKRLLDRLKRSPITTLQARLELDILGVAPRIFELRNWYGHNIKTHLVDAETQRGNRHLVAQYTLLPGVWKGDAAHG